MRYSYILTHNLKVVGSNPTPATNFPKDPSHIAAFRGLALTCRGIGSLAIPTSSIVLALFGGLDSMAVGASNFALGDLSAESIDGSAVKHHAADCAVFRLRI